MGPAAGIVFGNGAYHLYCDTYHIELDYGSTSVGSASTAYGCNLTVEVFSETGFIRVSNNGTPVFSYATASPSTLSGKVGITGTLSQGATTVSNFLLRD